MCLEKIKSAVHDGGFVIRPRGGFCTNGESFPKNIVSTEIGFGLDVWEIRGIMDTKRKNQCNYKLRSDICMCGRLVGF